MKKAKSIKPLHPSFITKSFNLSWFDRYVLGREVKMIPRNDLKEKETDKEDKNTVWSLIVKDRFHTIDLVYVRDTIIEAAHAQDVAYYFYNIKGTITGLTIGETPIPLWATYHVIKVLYDASVSLGVVPALKDCATRTSVYR